MSGPETMDMFAPNVLLGPIGMSLDPVPVSAEVRAAYGGLFAAAAYVFGAGPAPSGRRPLQRPPCAARPA